jgi:hypothetical protein
MGRIVTVSDGAGRSVTVSNWGGGAIIKAPNRPPPPAAYLAISFLPGSIQKYEPDCFAAVFCDFVSQICLILHFLDH